MNKPAAIYTRVSSDRQKESHTIASQTAALLEHAKSNGYLVPPEWVFQDEGYSGAILARPGLEALRDLAAQGQITTVLIYSPDRLSRKYAYQVLLGEEFSRCGVEIVFLKSPAGSSPEDQLVVQFQGMIAEYERAQIVERSRRGKRHKAKQGVVNVLSAAPYGYKYIRKTDCRRERPRTDWIEVSVPALISNETFALAEEQLTKNKHHSLRRTIEPSLLQGMLVCQRCGYALYRSSTRTSQRRLYYYRCFGSDAYRHLKGPLCKNRPVRQDYLDEFVWKEILHLLEDDRLVKAEIERRKETARNADPRQRRLEELRCEQTRLKKNAERLITAYQENLISLSQLRERMPELNKRTRTVETELQSLQTGAMDQAKYLQLSESLDGFRSKLRARAKTLNVCERQQIVRLLIKEILVDDKNLTICHSIPISPGSPTPKHAHPLPSSTPSITPQTPSYPLRWGSSGRSFRKPCGSPPS